MNRDTGRSDRSRKILLLVVNISIVTIIILLCVRHVEEHYKSESESARTSFCANVSSVKRVAGISLIDAQRACNDWTAWIDASDYNMDEAIRYLGGANTEIHSMASILDYDTLEGYSSKPNNKGNSAVDYSRISNIIEPVIYALKNESNQDNSLFITSSFINPITSESAVAFCRDIKIKEADGAYKHYLLLRVLDVSDLNQKWIFPKIYENGELSLINSSGNYIIKSKSMKRENFWEYVRICNDVHYSGAGKIRKKMYANEGEAVVLKNSEGKKSYFVCIPFDNGGNDLYYIGYMPISAIKVSQIDYTLVGIVALGMFMILVIDGTYILSMNKKLKIKSKQAKEASMAKTQFLSSMSHDIRTPLNAIVGLTMIASKHENEPEKIDKCLNKITLASNHLLTLINDILDISKIESGKVTLNPSTFSIIECVNEQLNIVKAQAKEKKLKLEKKLENIDHEYLYADELRINQIFINLLTNAIKYTEPGGEVSVELKEEKSDIDNMVVLTYIVSDTGSGMSEEFMKIMYDSFSRVSDTRTDKIQGSGLGLAITKQMIDIMDGTIDCKSKIGIGTTFTVKLKIPIADDKLNKIDSLKLNQSGSGRTIDDKKLEGMRVLVAEDNDINWEIIHEMLTMYDISSVRAENGSVCVDMLKNEKKDDYELVLMDVQMPVMNGLEATKMIRSMEDESKKIFQLLL